MSLIQPDQQVIYCLHGNLQVPDVWSCFQDRLLTHDAMPFTLEKVDLWHSIASSQEAWAGSFCEDVAHRWGGVPQVLMGYSLGGRLALHALVHQPRLWRAAVIIAADPGTRDEQLRISQRDVDRIWAQRFLHEPLDKLFDEWDALPVFGGKHNPIRRDVASFSAQSIAAMFTAYSKGSQACLVDKLKTLAGPQMLYLSGEKDEKYRNAGRVLEREVPFIRHIAVKDAAHRVPWEQPQAFIEAVNSFIHVHG
ncbi:MAG: alpha/beta fold hydrolase [Chitinivibrionales bacterium]|nr:alpha/beta fold hydrolase [Chitinivibrionales bacterium]